VSGSTTDQAASSEFDAYAGNYHAALERGVRLSGEDPSYFAEQRTALLGARLEELGVRPATVLDFGCGTGSTTPFLRGLPGSPTVIGTDASTGLLDEARRDHGGTGARFIPMTDRLDAEVEVAYCNGVFHHIAPHARARAVEHVRAALRPRGLFALWENNPWNPGTRLVMRRIDFDRDAVTLSARECRRLLESNGFDIVRTDFAFVFPHALRALRPLEARVRSMPLGAQYMVLARRAA
jgi:SAM-dependent methyltransferase